VALAPEVFEDVTAAEAAVPAVADPLLDNLIAAINDGQDPLAELDPTAATLSGGGGTGSTFIRLADVVEVTSPLALVYPRGALQCSLTALVAEPPWLRLQRPRRLRRLRLRRLPKPD
jgi:hypothetical protein